MTGPSLIFADRADLPKGMVLEAIEGRLLVLDGDGAYRGRCERRGDRWLWTAGRLTGIASDATQAWQAVTQVLCLSNP